MTHANDFIHLVSSQAVEGDNLGLTKREYFAAMAMQGYLASYDGVSIPDAGNVAWRAVEYADALINELNKNK
jgi:hypothetical protein